MPRTPIKTENFAEKSDYTENTDYTENYTENSVRNPNVLPRTPSATENSDKTLMSYREHYQRHRERPVLYRERQFRPNFQLTAAKNSTFCQKWVCQRSRTQNSSPFSENFKLFLHQRSTML